MTKQETINRIWQLIDPSIWGYSKTISFLLNFLDDDALMSILEDMEEKYQQEEQDEQDL